MAIKEYDDLLELIRGVGVLRAILIWGGNCLIAIYKGAAVVHFSEDILLPWTLYSPKVKGAVNAQRPLSATMSLQIRNDESDQRDAFPLALSSI